MQIANIIFCVTILLEPHFTEVIGIYVANIVSTSLGNRHTPVVGVPPKFSITLLKCDFSLYKFALIIIVA